MRRGYFLKPRQSFGGAGAALLQGLRGSILTGAALRRVGFFVLIARQGKRQSLLKEKHMKPQLGRTFESLENRYCMDVSVAVVGGDLRLSGDANGALEVAVLESGDFQVTDAGVVVATVAGVTDDLQIQLDADQGADNSVTLDLGGQTFDRLSVNLGAGDNTLTVQNGTLAGGFSYSGGNDADNVTLAGDLALSSTALVQLGDGNNGLSIAGSLERSLLVFGGAGDDTVALAADGNVRGDLVATLGEGANSTTIAGEIGRALHVSGGQEDDIVSILADASVGRDALLRLGNGDNQVSVAGTLHRNLTIAAGGGDDLVEILAGALIERSLATFLGNGDNQLVVGTPTVTTPDTLTVDTPTDTPATDTPTTDTPVAETPVDTTPTTDIPATDIPVDPPTDTPTDVPTETPAPSDPVEVPAPATIVGPLLYVGGNGNDTVSIETNGVIGGSVNLLLGGGANTVNHNGSIAGNFFVHSHNADDGVNVGDSATVGGETVTHLGTPAHGDHPPGHFGDRPGLGVGPGRGWRDGLFAIGRMFFRR